MFTSDWACQALLTGVVVAQAVKSQEDGGVQALSLVRALSPVKALSPLSERSPLSLDIFLCPVPVLRVLVSYELLPQELCEKAPGKNSAGSLPPAC